MNELIFKQVETHHVGAKYSSSATALIHFTIETPEGSRPLTVELEPEQADELGHRLREVAEYLLAQQLRLSLVDASRPRHRTTYADRYKG